MTMNTTFIRQRHTDSKPRSQPQGPDDDSTEYDSIETIVVYHSTVKIPEYDSTFKKGQYLSQSCIEDYD